MVEGTWRTGTDWWSAVRDRWNHRTMESEVLWTDTAQVAILGAQLMVLVAAALVAWRQVGEAKTLREQQSRPFVVIDFEIEGTLVFLQVGNIGNSLARDVTFEIDPPLKSAIDVDVSKLKMLNEGITTLAPGKRFRTLFDMGFRRAKADLPMTYTAVVRYTDESGQRDFEEQVDLDLDLFMDIQSVTRHGLHDVHARLKEIRDELKQWRSNTGQGIVAMSPKQARTETKRIQRRMEEQRKRRAERESGD